MTKVFFSFSKGNLSLRNPQIHFEKDYTAEEGSTNNRKSKLSGKKGGKKRKNKKIKGKKNLENSQK